MLPSQKNKLTISILGKLRSKGAPVEGAMNPIPLLGEAEVEGAGAAPTPSPRPSPSPDVGSDDTDVVPPVDQVSRKRKSRPLV